MPVPSPARPGSTLPQAPPSRSPQGPPAPANARDPGHPAAADGEPWLLQPSLSRRREAPPRPLPPPVSPASERALRISAGRLGVPRVPQASWSRPRVRARPVWCHVRFPDRRPPWTRCPAPIRPTSDAGDPPGAVCVARRSFPYPDCPPQTPRHPRAPRTCRAGRPRHPPRPGRSGRPSHSFSSLTGRGQEPSCQRREGSPRSMDPGRVGTVVTTSSAGNRRPASVARAHLPALAARSGAPDPSHRRGAAGPPRGRIPRGCTPHHPPSRGAAGDVRRGNLAVKDTNHCPPRLVSLRGRVSVRGTGACGRSGAGPRR